MTAQASSLFPVIDWSAAPATIVATIEAAAARAETRCGDATMVWRRWGTPVADTTPLILLHGGSGSWTHWIKVIPALAATMEVWAPDLPGLGESAMPPMPHTPASSAAVVAHGFHQLLGAHQRAHLLGFSFGAHVGTHAAALLGDRLATFTICGCAALGLPHNHIEFERERSTMTTAERDAVHHVNLARLMFADQRRIDPLAIYTHALNIHRARFRSRAFAATAEIPETLPRVAAPLRAIWGAADAIATPSVEARYAILRRHHPELACVTIPDAGHWVAYEQPQAFVSALRKLCRLP
jgi:pimeloyl-ACP methyl ester carboxylesterase